MSVYTAEMQEVRQLADYLTDQRQPYDDVNRLVGKYILPSRTRIARDMATATTLRPSGAILNAKATRCMRIGAAGMQGGLTPPSNRWFRYGVSADDELSEWGPARLWLDLAERRTAAAMHRGPFYAAMHSMYLELMAFGTGNIFSEPHYKTTLWHRVLPWGQFAWGCDSYGRIDTQVTRRPMTAKALAEQFGPHKLTEHTKRLLDKDPYEHVSVVHVVRPRRIVNPERMDAQGMPWETLWYEEDGGKDFVHRGGFRRFPFLCCRWDLVAQETYGGGLGHEMLPDAKMLQELERQHLTAIQKVNNPPMRVPSQFKGRLSMIPGGQTEVSTTNPEAITALYQIRPDLSAVAAKIQAVEQALEEGSLVTLFQAMATLEKSGITATEILQRQQEKMSILGPVVERLQSECLGPAVATYFEALAEAGELPPPPKELAGLDLEIEYISPLASAQRMTQSQSMLTWLTLVGQAATASQDVMDKVDWDEVVDTYGEMLGVPAKVVRSDKAVSDLRNRRALAAQKQQQMQAGLEMLKAAPQAAQSLSETYVQGQPALDRAAAALPM
jgi:hypothetical protein